MHTGVFPELVSIFNVPERYLAPEYATSGKLTAKTDVFAFGVVILQALTGKRPGEESLGDYGLAKWVHKTWKDKSLEAVLDPILRYDPTTEETQVQMRITD